VRFGNLGQLLPARDDLLAQVIDILLVRVGDTATGQQADKHHDNDG
jgi:hypothetical protein